MATKYLISYIIKERAIKLDLIRLRAYLKWQSAGCPSNKELDFWIAAEQEVQSAGIRRSGGQCL